MPSHPEIPAAAVAAMQEDLAAGAARAGAGTDPDADLADLDALLGRAPGGAALAPLRIGELGAFVRAARPLLGALASGDLAGAVLEHADALIDTVCIGARVERAWLEAQTPEVLIDLAARVIEVNGDFFVRTLAPTLTAATARVGRLTGAMSSPA